MKKLSPREREVVELVGRDGLQWKSAARRMGISLSTVRNHAARIMAKADSRRAPREAMVEIYLRECVGVGVHDRVPPD